MGLFGKGLSAQNGLDFLLGGYGGLDRRRAIDANAAQKSASDAAYAKLQGVLTPQAPTVAPAPADTQGLTPFAAALQGQAQGAPQAPTQPQAAQGITWDQLLPALTEAQHAGIDTSDILRAYQAAHPDPTVFNTAGGIVSVDPRQGAVRNIYTPVNPNADLDRAEQQAKIDYYKAGSTQRDSQGDYYQAKAKQPYAPPRPRSAGGRVTSTGHVTTGRVYGSGSEPTW